MGGEKMSQSSIKFYTNRIKTAVLAVGSIVFSYVFYTKLLADPVGLTDTAIIVIWGSLIILVLLGLYTFLKTLDPRPIVEMSADGLLIRKHIFFENHIKWEEIADLKQEQYTNRHMNMAGSVKVTTNILKIYRPNQRPISINLTLLNQQGSKFKESLSRYLAS